MTHKQTERMKGGRAEGHIPTPRPRGQRTTCAMPGVRVGVPLKRKTFFSFSSTSHRRNGKKTRAHINGGGCNKLTRCLLFYFPLREWPRFENCFRKVFVWCAFFPIFFIFQFRALLTKEMEKEHAHINGGGCNKLATCFFSIFFLFGNAINHIFFSCVCTRALHMCFHSYMCKDLANSSQFPPPPNHARAAQAHLVPLFCRSLTPSSISSFLSCIGWPHGSH